MAEVLPHPSLDLKSESYFLHVSLFGLCSIKRDDNGNKAVLGNEKEKRIMITTRAVWVSYASLMNEKGNICYIKNSSHSRSITLSNKQNT